MAQGWRTGGEISRLGFSKGKLDLIEEICSEIGDGSSGQFKGDAGGPLSLSRRGYSSDRVLADVPFRVWDASQKS